MPAVEAWGNNDGNGGIEASDECALPSRASACKGRAKALAPASAQLAAGRWAAGDNDDAP
jgi:hypothetical protein